MKTLKIGVMLLALLLAAMVMYLWQVPMRNNLMNSLLFH